VPFRQEVAVVVPFRLGVEAVGHRNQAGVEVRQRTHCTERGQPLCFSVVVKVRAVAEPRLEQVHQGRGGRPRAHSQRTSDRSAGCSLLPEETAH
jgi:hypothetical protein